jgi:hypothetical protein
MGLRRWIAYTNVGLERRVRKALWNGRSKGFASITLKTIGMLFDVFVQQVVWRSQPISQKVFHKGYGEAISAASEIRLVEQEEVDSPSLKIFPHP